ncbi:DUF305 domain-containing protein [Deinococcus pimensis]|uniref:DUF305 domain-containing protein n=1 Tax=Deinococcus pimensis TaxID=309888 RepID=UPI000486FF48|nr:DUF305 domain-containing protein [Deinococcus pimensis]
MSRKLIPTALALVAALGAAQTHQHTAPQQTPAAPMAPMTPPATGAHAHGPDLSTLSGRAFDRAYLSMMIAHHEAAVGMSDAALKRGGDPRVKGWAQQVRDLQVSELREMNAMLRDYDLGGLDRAAHDAMAADMKPMVDAVTAGPNPDEAWVRGMLEHHALALRMATEALLRSDTERVRRAARAVAKVQAEQMYEYRTWAPDR